MPELQKALSSTAYALFALEQPLPLDALAQGSRAGAFPAAQTHTPDWFAAAADGSGLLETAPELQVLPTDLEEAEAVDVTGIDLIHVYAPEMQAIVEADERRKADDAEVVLPPASPPATPRTSTQLGLLKELGNLDD